jgi:hypothetical protein
MTKIAAFFVLALTCAAAPLVHAAYRFKVHNNTEQTIVNLLVSEHGEDPREFDIGNGIAPGTTATLEWDESTDESDCEWAFTAVFDDGTYSEPAIIDFCEGNLELEFNDE